MYKLDSIVGLDSPYDLHATYMHGQNKIFSCHLSLGLREQVNNCIHSELELEPKNICALILILVNTLASYKCSEG